MQLVVHERPDPSIRDALFARIDAYNDAMTGRPEPVRHLSIALRGSAGAVEGGLIGISYYDWLIVEMLFVPEGLRGHGIGARLMRAAEAVAAERDCIGLWVDTGSQAAKAFYERIGWTVYARLDDHPAGNPRWWLKRMAPQPGVLAGLEVQEARDPAVAGVIGPALGAVADELFGPDPARRTLAITAGEAGGLWMRVHRSWLFLDLFILDEAARRGGTGRRILAMAEALARQHGCHGVWLDTYGFQAPGFYAGQGYEQFGVLPDYPAPHGRHWLRKRFK